MHAGDLGEAALAHYADFGHSAIYALKIGQLVKRLGGEAVEPLLLALTRSLVRCAAITRNQCAPMYDL